MANMILLPKHYTLVASDVDVNERDFEYSSSGKFYIPDLNLPFEDNVDEIAWINHFDNPFEVASLYIKELPKPLALKLMYLVKNNKVLDFNALYSVETSETGVSFCFMVEDNNFHELFEFIVKTLSDKEHNPSHDEKINPLDYFVCAFRSCYDSNFNKLDSHTYKVRS